MKHFIWIFSLMLILSGCSTTKNSSTVTPVSSTPKANWPAREAALNKIHSWHINGKIAVQSTKDSGSASVDWYQRGGQYSVALQGPLGAGAMKLYGRDGQVSLIGSDGKTYRAASAEQLLAKQWGFHLPVSNMNYWIRGLPVPGTQSKTMFDNQGRLATVIQQGYRVDYLSYSNAGKIDMPERISIVSPALRVKLVVYKWNLG